MIKRVLMLSSLFVAVFLLHIGLFWSLAPISSQDLKQRSRALYVHASKKVESHAFFMPSKKSLSAQTALTDFALKDTSISPWWHHVPTDKPFMPRAVEPQEQTAKIFWRGPAAAFLREIKPIVMKLANADSAYTLCYHVEVDLKTGRMLYLQPIREDLNPQDAQTVRTLLWQQPFKPSSAGGIVSGEVELCFGGEYE